MLKQNSILSHVLMTCGLVVVAAGLLVTAVSAQVLYGRITGIITDSSGAAVANATVKAVDLATGISRETQANTEGTYVFTDLNPGLYQVTASATNFASKRQEGIRLQSNTVVRVNMQLAIGSVSQSIEVTTAPPVLQTDTAVVDYNISSQQVAELPTTGTSGRNFQGLFKLVPGISPPAQSQSATANPNSAQIFNVNGMSSASNTTRIDGAIDGNPWQPALVAYLPPSDGIESVNMVTGSFNAEQGMAGGAAVNVTIKSGTNKLHGSVWEYNSVAQFNAQQWQNRTGVRAKNIYNETGGTLGGPIIKNKLFFFGDFNRTEVNKVLSNIFSVPTMAMRSGNFSATGATIFDPATGNSTGKNKTAFANNTIPSARIAPAASILLAKLPAPNTGAAGALTQNYAATGPYTFFRKNMDGKLTYVPNQKSSYFGHYSASLHNIYDPQVFGNNAGGPTLDGGNPSNASGYVQNVGLGATYAVTPKLLVDANFGYTRQQLLMHTEDDSLGDYGANTLLIPGTNLNGNKDYAGIPGMAFTTYTNFGNVCVGCPFGFFDTQITGNVNATWTHGTHSIRFGGEYIHILLNHNQPGSGGSSTGRGTFTFNGGVSGTTGPYTSIADFLLGQAYSYGKGIKSYQVSAYRGSSISGYVQDTWQVTSHLTLNYGLRYEIYPLPKSDHFGMLRYDPSIPTTVTDSFGTHTVGTVLIGGMGSTPKNAGTNNGHGMFMPRLGISYRINDKTVVRTGFGITVDPTTLYNNLQAYPEVVGVAVSGANTSVAATSLNANLPNIPPGLSIPVGIPAIVSPSITSGSTPLPATMSTYTTSDDYRRGYIYSYNLAFQRELPKNFTVNMAYVGTIGVRLATTVNSNASSPGGGQAGQRLNVLYGANTNNSTINLQMPWKGSNYHGLQAQLSRMSEHRGSTGLVYTYSKAMDFSDNGVFAGGGTGGTGAMFAYPTYWSRNYARAGYDRKHNFQWWTTYPLPFGPGQIFFTSGPAGFILGHWQVSTVLSRVSGTPITVTGSSGLLNAPGNSQVADRNANIAMVLNQNTNAARQYLNPAAFCDVASSTTRSDCTTTTTPRFGTSSRNVVRGPGTFNLDVTLKRSFPLWESVKLNLSAEVFDVTNTPQFPNPNAAISNVTVKSGVLDLGGFGTLITSNVNRTMRLSGRISF